MLNYKLKDEAFRLRDEENMTYSEISQHLNIAYSTVKTWFFRAGRSPHRNNVQAQGEERYARPNRALSNNIQRG